MNTSDFEVIGALIRRVEWREGPVPARLKKAAKRARWRAKHYAWVDSKRERRIARLADAVRKALEEDG